MMFTPLQLPSVYHNPCCDGVCTWCWRKSNAKEEFARQNVAKERLSVIYTSVVRRLLTYESF